MAELMCDGEVAMKHVIALTAMTVFAASGAFAATGTWTGKISDSGCGASHAKMKAQHPGTDAECTVACVKGGGKYVFVSGGKVYTIANQDEKDLALNAGKTVKLTGDIEGTSITVSNVAASGKKSKKS
jgi:hypothetical protein